MPAGFARASSFGAPTFCRSPSPSHGEPQPAASAPQGVCQGTDAHSARRADGGESLLLRRRRVIGVEVGLTFSGDRPRHHTCPANL